MESLKNNKLLVVVILLLIVSGFFFTESNDNSSTNVNFDNYKEMAANNSVDEEQIASSDSTKTNDLCQEIDDSDVVIQLDLPEEYAHYNDENIYPSYETGFIYKSSYGDVASSRELARKNCNYRVGFNKTDFEQISYNPNYPLIIYAVASSTTDFTYGGDPQKISIGGNGLPEQGSEFIVNVTGETNSYGHYDSIFE